MAVPHARLTWAAVWLAVVAGLTDAATGQAVPPPGQPKAVQLTVMERAGVARAGEYVSFGVPLPRAWNVTDPQKLRLRDAAGKPVPADFHVLGRWGGPPQAGTAPIKWALVGLIQSLPAGGKAAFTLDAAGPRLQPETVVRVDTAAAGTMTVDTGAARFELLTTDRFNLINQVTIGDSKLLAPLAARDALQFLPAGELGLVESQKLTLQARPVSATVERAGRLGAVVKVTGSLFDPASRPVLDFTARLHFVAGRSDVRVDFTVENNHPILADENGQPTNAHKQGSAYSVYVGGLRLRLRLADSAKPVHVLTEPDVSVAGPKGAVRLYQDSSGTNHWNAYLGKVGWPDQQASASPRLQSYCTRKGYEVSGPDVSPARSGDQALGWMTVSREPDGPRLTAAVRDFWQNFPKAIQAEPDGTLGVDLFPNGQQFRHNLRVGEQKTHTLLLAFSPGGPPAAQESADRAKAFNSPLLGAPPAGWHVATGALGEAPAADLARWPLYERYVRIAFEPNPDFDPAKDDPNFGNRTLRQVIEHYNLFGWQDYGDVPLDFEAFGPNQAGQFNLKYWFVYGLFLQFCRSGEPRWLDVARPAAWHLADIDILHVPDKGPAHWAHGAYFGHSEHDEPGNVNPNRNANSPSVDLFFGVPDLLLAYHLTGEQRFRDVAAEAPEAMIRQMEFSDLNHPIFTRERANLIFGFLEAYRATGQQRWLDAARKVVAATANLSNKTYLTDPAAYGKDHPGEFISMFSFCQVVWALGKYLDFCDEYGLKDETKSAEAIRAFADFLVKFAKKEYAPGRATTMNQFHPDGAGTDTYLEINNWALVMADVLALAYRQSGEKRYLDEAAKFYASGTIDPVWKDDAPVFLNTKDLVNSLNWGLVYMNQTLRAGAAKPPGR